MIIVITVLCGLAAVLALAQTMILTTIWREIVSLEAVSATDTPRDQFEGMLGSSLPEFQAPYFGSSETVTDGCLRGKQAMLLFLVAQDALAMKSGGLLAITLGLWTHVDESIHIICSGAAEECALIRDELMPAISSGMRILMAHDPDHRVRRQFGLDNSLCSLLYDQSGKLVKVGRPEA